MFKLELPVFFKIFVFLKSKKYNKKKEMYWGIFTHSVFEITLDFHHLRQIIFMHHIIILYY